MRSPLRELNSGGTYEFGSCWGEVVTRLKYGEFSRNLIETGWVTLALIGDDVFVGCL